MFNACGWSSRIEREEILAEVPATLRHLRTFLLVLSISVPLLLVGLVAVLWHFAH